MKGIRPMKKDRCPALRDGSESIGKADTTIPSFAKRISFLQFFIVKKVIYRFGGILRNNELELALRGFPDGLDRF